MQDPLRVDSAVKTNWPPHLVAEVATVTSAKGKSALRRQPNVVKVVCGTEFDSKWFIMVKSVCGTEFLFHLNGKGL